MNKCNWKTRKGICMLICDTNMRYCDYHYFLIRQYPLVFNLEIQRE